jgi:hypothetical protein
MQVFQVLLNLLLIIVLTLRRVVGTQRIVVALLLAGCAVRVGRARGGVVYIRA